MKEVMEISMKIVMFALEDCIEGFSALTWRTIMMRTQTCCFTRVLGV